jgi:hypothetical protein
MDQIYNVGPGTPE